MSTSTTSPSAWFITGCSPGGLGHHLALQLLSLDPPVPVIVSSRNPSNLDDLVKKGAQAIQWDVSDDEDVLGKKAREIDAMVDGGVAVVVNNAGLARYASAEESDFSDFRLQFETNFFGLVKTTRAFLPLFRSRKTGTCVNISSVAGFSGGAGYSAYAAAKYAVEGFSESLAKEVAHLGIRVLVVNPGFFRTNFLASETSHAVGPIEDYLPITRPLEEFFTAYAGKQPGDPALGGQAIIDVVLARGHAKGIEWTSGQEAAERLLLGPDAVALMQGAVERRSKEVEKWKVISEGTDLEEVKEEKRKQAAK
ncbi:hypothetical protein JCM11251_000166 [Rhodosporidiobolus azoricus]